MVNYYYVPDGNWTTKVLNTLGNGTLDALPFTVNLDGGDPARGCEKIFTAKYKCGSDAAPLKNVSISKPAEGQIANFDCVAESQICNKVSVYLGDDGVLQIKNTVSGETIWDSAVNGSFPVIDASTIVPANSLTNPPNNRPLTLPEYAGDGQPKPSVDVGAGGGPGRRYPYPYLIAGQFLELGQWIGSPSGTCRLIMGTPDAPNSLQVVTNILGCNSLDTPALATVDANANRLYTIPNMYNANLGKVGYVDNYGQLNLYPDSLTTYNDHFENIGSYNMTSAAFLGTSTAATDVDECQALCTSSDNTTDKIQNCGGFIFDTTAARCQLLDKRTMFAQKRIIDKTDNHQYYVRAKNVTGQDLSCPSDVTADTSLFFNSLTPSTTNPTMSASTTCGLRNFVASQTATVASDLPSLYSDLEYKDQNGNVTNIKYSDLVKNTDLKERNKTTFKYWYETLQHSYKNLTANIFDTKKEIKQNFDELIDARQNLADWTGQQLQNLTAMNEDRDLNMMSQNYRHIMWSILAIVIIIATMKFTKIAASGAAAAAK
jgi:hypothetical protein